MGVTGWPQQSAKGTWAGCGTPGTNFSAVTSPSRKSGSPPELSEAEKDNLRQRMLREARSAARLNHPAVATVHDVVEDLGRPWIVMELVHGRSLDLVDVEHRLRQR